MRRALEPSTHGAAVPLKPHKIFSMPFARVYPLYLTKVEKKGRTREELYTVITWLTGFDDAAIAQHVEAETTFADFFAAATLHDNVGLITGKVCGVRVEDVEDPLMQQIRWLDKLVDELARGKKLASILRT